MIFYMPDDKNKKLNAWANFLNALGSLTGKLIWGFIVVIIFSMIGRHLFFSGDFPTGFFDKSQKTRTVTIQTPIEWHEIDRQTVMALKASSQAAEKFAAYHVAQWIKDLENRVDSHFLDWYFGYWNQQWLGLKGIGYWTTEKIFSNQPSMAEQITEDIQDEFSKRVLRPQIAQMKLERIATKALNVYVKSLRKNLAAIPEKYNIPQADWDRYLSDIAVITSVSEGNREISLSLKTLTATGIAGGTTGAALLVKSVKPMIVKIGSKATTKVAAKSAGKATAKIAAKTGTKVSAKTGGKLLGPIIGVGIIIWDVWDHHHTREIEKPILRENLMAYFAELKESLMYDPDSGIISIINSVERTIVSSL